MEKTQQIKLSEKNKGPMSTKGSRTRPHSCSPQNAPQQKANNFLGHLFLLGFFVLQLHTPPILPINYKAS